MSKTKRSEAQARAAADRAYLEQVRGGQGGPTSVGAQASGVQPVPPPDRGVHQTAAMPYVPTAAPSPVLGVSPILGESTRTSPPPVGSFHAPPVGPPAPAYASQAFQPTPDDVAQRAAASANPVSPSGGGSANGGGSPNGGAPADVRPSPNGPAYGAGPLLKAGAPAQPSFVEQNPHGSPNGSGSPVATLAPQPQYPQPQYPQQQYPGEQYPAPQYPNPQYQAPQYPATPQPPMSPSLDLPLLLGPSGTAPTGDLVTCPECGEMATVDAARRKSEDFCRNCDFPLFWARTTVILSSGEETGASLRRLPGTVGRAATAALMCPHCGEPNSPAAQTCVRCLLSLHPVELPPEPVYIAPPAPEPMPVAIGREFPLWWIMLVSTCVLAITLIVVWIVVN